MSKPTVGETGWEKRVMLYLTKEQHRTVTRFAQENGISIAEVGRQALQFYIDAQAAVAASLAMRAKDVNAEEA